MLTPDRYSRKLCLRSPGQKVNNQIDRYRPLSVSSLEHLLITFLDWTAEFANSSRMWEMEPGELEKMEKAFKRASIQGSSYFPNGRGKIHMRCSHDSFLGQMDGGASSSRDPPFRTLRRLQYRHNLSKLSKKTLIGHVSSHSNRARARVRPSSRTVRPGKNALLPLSANWKVQRRL
jgi:hypothetical protein